MTRNWIQEDIKTVKKYAERRNPGAAYELACRLITGRDEKCDRNPITGFGWALLAARLGYAKAQTLVGYCYIHGIGIEVNGRDGIHWFKRGARSGDPVAFYNLGCCYLVGIEFRKSVKAAQIYFQYAANMGYPKAKAALAKFQLK